MNVLNAILAGVCITGCAVSGSGTGKLPVVVLDYAGTPPGTLAKAAVAAKRAFQRLGIETDWSVCRVSASSPGHCPLPPSGSFLEVQVVPSEVEAEVGSLDGLGYAVVCPATRRCTKSHVFYGPALAVAQDAGQSVYVLLAYAVVHELGHVLGLPHGRSGIMKAHSDQHDIRAAARGRLRFTPGEASFLRQAVDRFIASSGPRAQSETEPQIEVLVNRPASISRAMLVDAERVAGRIFKAAGVQLDWIDCAGREGPADARCAIPPGPAQLVLNVIGKTGSAQARFGAARLNRDGRPAQCATLFEQSIENATAGGPAVTRDLLGYIIAHELGHLLLGADSHSELGIMRPRWPRLGFRSTPLAAFLFTAEQSKALRQAVRARMRAQSPK